LNKEIAAMYMLETDGWYVERATFLVAGIVVLSSAALAWLHSMYWLLLTGFAGANLVIFGLSGFCLMSNILVKLGVGPRLGRQG